MLRAMMTELERRLALAANIRTASHLELWESTPEARLAQYRYWVAKLGCTDVAAAAKAVSQARRQHRLDQRRREPREAHTRRQGRIYRYNRALVMAGEPRCSYCGAAATDADHIIPRRLGGSSQLSNLTPACGPCNRLKSGRTPEEWLTA